MSTENLKIEKFGYEANIQTYGNGFAIKTIVNGKEMIGSITQSMDGYQSDSCRSVCFYIGKKKQDGSNYLGSIYLYHDKTAEFEMKDLNHKFSVGKLRYKVEHYKASYIIRKCRDLLYSFLKAEYNEQIREEKAEKQLTIMIKKKEQKNNLIREDILQDIRYYRRLVEESSYNLSKTSVYRIKLRKILKKEYLEAKKNLKNVEERLINWDDIHPKVSSNTTDLFIKQNAVIANV
jgi:hypothetical protein